MNKKLSLEFWSDSFHEGNWACEELKSFFELLKLEFLEGFIPSYTYKIFDGTEINITVYGSYKNWSPLPNKIKELLDWGKPDLVIYNPITDQIILAMEETAAIPTGNQALQRCERIFGSARLKIPFWYLIGEFGVHKDGGTRRDSIWPTILSIRLSNVYKNPCVTLHYSDKDHPEDYTIGEGVKTLFESISIFILEHFGRATKVELFNVLQPQYQKMNEFVDSQWKSLVSFMPLSDKLIDQKVNLEVVQNSLENAILTDISKELYCWPTTKGLPLDFIQNLKPNGYINEEKIVLELEKLVLNKKAYNIVIGAGSKPQKLKDIKIWIKQQEAIVKKSTIHKGLLVYDKMSFVKTEKGNYHLTTAKNVFYLIDESLHLEKILMNLYQYKQKLKFGDNQPVFFYLANSMKPGRIFGDPFTGQLSAFANIFTKNNSGEKERLSIAYYPYQVHNQLFDKNGDFNINKGITIMRELLDFAIFHGGVIVDFKNGKIIC
jgi:hypothetical protein